MPLFHTQNVGYVSVKQFGAVGNGTTDDATALQAGFAWSATFGVWLYLEPGYYLTNSVLTPVSGMRVCGAGYEKTEIWQSLTNYTSIISIGISSTVSDVILEDLTLNGRSLSRTTTGTAGHCFSGYNFNRITFNRVRLKEGLGYGFGAQGHPAGGVGKTGPMNELTMNDCIIEWCGHGKFRQVSLTTALTSSDTSITVSDGTQLDPSGGTLMIVANTSVPLGEIVKHGTVTGNTAPIVRGICSTTPSAWSAGAVVYRLSNGDGFDSKSGFRFTFNNVISRYNGDNGINLRCNKGTIANSYCYGNGGPGIGINANTSEDQYDTRTTLNGAVTATDTSFTLTDASAFPSSGLGRINSETFTWASKAGNVLNGIVRGLNGTYAIAHDTLSNVSVDPNNNDADSIINVIGSHTFDNTSAGISVASGSSSSKAQVNIIAHTSYGNGGGLNLSGGGMGSLGVNVSGGTFSENLGDGVIIADCETVTFASVTVEGNTEDGIRLVDQSNGGVISACDIRNNGGWAVYEAGVTNNMRYLGGIIKANTAGKFRLVGANSVVRNVEGWVNEQTALSASLPVDATGLGTTTVVVPLTLDQVDLNKTSVEIIKEGTSRSDWVATASIDACTVSQANVRFKVTTASAFAGTTVKVAVTARS